MIILQVLLHVGLIVSIFLVLQMLHFTIVIAWSDWKTRGNRYFGKFLPARNQFKRTLSIHRCLLIPLLKILPRGGKATFTRASIIYEGIAFPKYSCDSNSVRSAIEYDPDPEDIFVVTQMRCGTTWMQHLVYQILMRGTGNIVEEETTLYAISPWIESYRTVSIDDAPPVGVERKRNIIKTHLTAQQCPYNENAKYIYVTRHPISCFASCIDFIQQNFGDFSPSLEIIEQWYCSHTQMWWGSWPNHVDGWWGMSEKQSNVLFVLFEDMKKDLRKTIKHVAEFLVVEDLSNEEIAEIEYKCSFQYMSNYEECFEMSAPNILQPRRSLFVSGDLNRHKHIPEAMKQRVTKWILGSFENHDAAEEIYNKLNMRTSAI